MLSESVKKAWRDHTRVNGELLEHLEPEMLKAQTPGGGYSVAQHLAHLTASTKSWGTYFDKAHLGELPDLFEDGADDDDTEAFIVETDLERVREVMSDTHRVVLEAAEKAQDKGDLPHTSLDAYLIHMMVHNAHHRGQIMLALKTSGYTLPGDDAIWGPWRGA